MTKAATIRILTKKVIRAAAEKRGSSGTLISINLAAASFPAKIKRAKKVAKMFNTFLTIIKLYRLAKSTELKK